MRWFDAMIEDNSAKHPFVSGADDLQGYEGWQLETGHRIESWNPAAFIQATNPRWDGAPDDALHNHLALPIYSPRLQNAIHDAGFTGIQFLPIRVLHQNGIEIQGFAIANVLNVPTAMDMEKSKYDKFGEDYFAPADRGRVRAVYNMVLKQHALNCYDIVRPREYPVSTYVSERFKHAFERANCSGYSFQEVEIS